MSSPDRDRTTLPGTEVKGIYSVSQQQEYSVLAAGIAQNLNITPESSNMQDIPRIIDDSLSRGLKIQNRIWVDSDEDISPVFSLGLQERIGVLEAVKNEVGLQELLGYGRYIQTDHAVGEWTALDVDFGKADNLLKDLRSQRKEIAKLHQILFTNPYLHDKVAVLRQELDKDIKYSDRWPEVAKELDENERLFRSLSISIILHNKADVLIDPYDLGAVIAMWADPTVAVNSAVRFSTIMDDFAKRAGLNSERIRNYAEAQMDDMIPKLSLEIEEVPPNPFSEYVLEDFAVHPTVLRQVMENERKGQEKRIRQSNTQERISTDDKRHARVIQEQIFAVQNQLEDIANNELADDFTDEDLKSTEYERIHIESLTPLYKQLTPKDLLLIELQFYQPGGNLPVDQRDFQLSLAEFTPMSTYIGLSNLLEEPVIDEESQKDLAQGAGSMIRREVRERILRTLLEDLPIEQYTEYIQKVSDGLFGEYLTRASLATLNSEDDRYTDALVAIGNDRWVNILSDIGEIETIGEQKESKTEFDFVYNSATAQDIAVVLNKMSDERRRAIAGMLHNRNTFQM